MKDKVYYTKNEISKLIPHISRSNLFKYLLDLKPDGTKYKSGNLHEAYSLENVNRYLSNMIPDYRFSCSDQNNDLVDNSTSKELLELDVRAKTARAISLELDNAERLKLVVSKRSAEGFIRYICTMYCNKIKEITKEGGDEYYNDIMAEIQSEIEQYPSGNDDDVLKELYDSINEEKQKATV